MQNWEIVKDFLDNPNVFFFNVMKFYPIKFYFREEKMINLTEKKDRPFWG